MKKTIQTLAYVTCSFSVTLGLVACGGGGSSSSPTAGIAATAGDKYVGTWFGACTNSGANSSRGVSVIGKLGDNLYSLTNRTDNFSGAGCVTATTQVPISTNNFRLTGTTAVGGAVADKVATPDFGSTDLLYLPTPTTLQVGDPASGRDADGYPTGLNSAIATKQ